MRNDVGDDVGVANYAEVEAPVLVDSGLSFIFGFVVLLGVKGRMAEVPN
jgi:hypothetical protein